MKLVALICAVVVVVKARPQAEPQIKGGVVDVVAEFDKFHQLWLAEAKRNSMPVASPFKTVSSATEQKGESMPKQEAQVRAAEPVAEVQEVQQEVQPAVVEVVAEVPDMNAAFANFHALWTAEAARNAIAPSVVAVKSPVLVAQPIAEVKQASTAAEEPVIVAGEESVAKPAPIAAPDHEAEALAFHALWKQEAERNAIAPVFQPQPAPVPTPIVQPVTAPKAASPVVALPTPVATPLKLPTNFGGNLGTQPIIFILPNWSPAV